MNNKQTIQALKSMDACNEAVRWAKEHGGTSQEIWDGCERGDWMGWYLGKQDNYNQTPEFYLALAEIVEKQCVPIYAKFNKEDRVLVEVVKTLRLYAEGKATREDLRNAAARSADAADSAAYAAANAAARSADAADSADAAYAATYAAAYAAANAAARSADAAYAEGREKSLKQSASIFRKYFPEIQ